MSAPQTMLAGQIFGDFGADVITLEPPGGAAGRRLPPFDNEHLGLESSLTWHALNRNKRGVTIDVASPDGTAILGDLLRRVDVVFESIDGPSIPKDVPRPDSLVVCEITNFSPAGPKSGYVATDPVLVSAGGAPAMAGDADRAPLYFPVPQSIYETGAEAAIAALSGLLAHDRLGVGQTVEVQGRVASLLTSLGRLVSGRSGAASAKRAAPRPSGRMPQVPSMYQCADGWVTISVLFMPAFVAMTQHIVDWLADEGALASQIAVSDLVREAASGDDGRGGMDDLLEALIGTCRRKTKIELVEISQKYRFMAAPAMNMADIAHFEHYHKRGLFALQSVGGRDVNVPARFAQFSDYEIEVRRSAPALSEHTVEILTEWAGLSLEEIQALFAAGVI